MEIDIAIPKKQLELWLELINEEYFNPQDTQKNIIQIKKELEEILQK